MCVLVSGVPVFFPLWGDGVPTSSRFYHTLRIYMCICERVRTMTYHNYCAYNYLEANVTSVAGQGTLHSKIKWYFSVFSQYLSTIFQHPNPRYFYNMSLTEPYLPVMSSMKVYQYRKLAKKISFHHVNIWMHTFLLIYPMTLWYHVNVSQSIEDTWICMTFEYITLFYLIALDCFLFYYGLLIQNTMKQVRVPKFYSRETIVFIDFFQWYQCQDIARD